MAENFGGGKLCKFCILQQIRHSFIRQLLKIEAGVKFAKLFFTKYSLYSLKFPPAKVSIFRLGL